MSSTKQLINSLLIDVFNHILTIEADILKKKGVELSMTEVHVIEAIFLTDIKTMGNVARKLKVTLGTLTTSIDVLEKKGYVKRRKDEKDRRRILLSLTKKAEEVLKIHETFHAEMINSIFKDLNIEEEEVLVKSLQNVHDFFKDRY